MATGLCAGCQPPATAPQVTTGSHKGGLKIRVLFGSAYNEDHEIAVGVDFRAPDF